MGLHEAWPEVGEVGLGRQAGSTPQMTLNARWKSRDFILQTTENHGVLWTKRGTPSGLGF